MTKSRTLWCAALLLLADSFYLAAVSEPSAPYLAALLLHPLLGLVFLVLLARWWRGRREAVAGAGRAVMPLLVASVLAGVALPFLLRVPWRSAVVTLHVLAAVAGLVLLGWALARARDGVPKTVAALLAGAAPILLLVHLLLPVRQPEPTPLDNPLPPATLEGEALGGASGPFYPSAARTRDGALRQASAAPAAQSCGRSGCHPRELAEWEASPHRWAGLDNPWYAAALADFQAHGGSEGTRTGQWCAGCHTPELLLAGRAGAPANTLASAALAAEPLATAGVSCTACHGMSRVRSTTGNADFELGSTAVERLASSPSAFARGLHAALLRLDPDSHRRSFARPLLSGVAASEMCGSCHKAHVDKPLNGYRLLPVMNDYDSWQGASISGQGVERSLYFPPPQGCVDCHMTPSPAERGRGLDAGAVSHRFVGANTALPTLHGDKEQLAAVESYLTDGQVSLDLFALGEGRRLGAELAPDTVEAVFAPLDRFPASVRRGESNRFDLVVRARHLGHQFPGGKTDLTDCWIELRAVDEHGREVLVSGGTTPVPEGGEGDVEPSAHFFRSLWIDQEGRAVENHDFHDARAVIYIRRMETNTANVVRFRLEVPPVTGNQLAITARLRYRPFRPSFDRWAFGEKKPPTVAPVTMAEARASLAVLDAEATLPERIAAPDKADALRWYDYGIGLALQGDFRGSRPALRKAVELDPSFTEGWVTVGRLAVVAGDLEEARSTLGKALEQDPANARAMHFLGLAERAAGNFPRAIELISAAAARYPRDTGIQTQLANTLVQSGDQKAAAEAFRRVLAVDPEDSASHFSLARIYRALGDKEAADRHQALFERYKADETSQQLTRSYLEAHPHDNLERQRVHEHTTSPLTETPR